MMQLVICYDASDLAGRWRDSAGEEPGDHKGRHYYDTPTRGVERRPVIVVATLVVAKYSCATLYLQPFNIAMLYYEAIRHGEYEWLKFTYPTTHVSANNCKELQKPEAPAIIVRKHPLRVVTHIRHDVSDSLICSYFSRS